MNQLPGLISIILLVFAVSCNTPRFVYSPPAHNAPVLTKKGDSKVGALYSTSYVGRQTEDGEEVYNKSRGYDVHGAVAVTDHFAIQAGHFYRWEKTEGGRDNIMLKYKRNITEIGLGYFRPINEKKNVFFQIFAGAGLGKFSFTDITATGANFHETNISKIYLQPAFLMRSNGSFTNTIALRFSSISYSKIKTSYTIDEQDDYKLDGLNRRSKIFFEPAYVGSFGIKNLPGLRFEFQGSLSLLLDEKYVDYRKFNLSAGTWIDIGALFNKNKQ